MKRRRLTVLILLHLFLIVPLTAQSQHIAKYGGEFMSIGTGPRALGMGGAFVAVADGSIASYWNPAGLGQLDYPEINLMYSEQFSGVIKYNYAVAAAPLRAKAGIGVGLLRIGIDDIPFTALINPNLPVGAIFEDEYGNQIRNTSYIDHYMNDVEYVGYFSYAKQENKNRWYGANVKIIHKATGDHSAWGLGFDVGLLLSVYRHLRLGVNLQDVTTTLVAWDTGNKELISPNLKWGLTYLFQIRSLTILPAVDIDTRFEGRKFASQAHIGGVSLDSHYGVEIAYRQVVFLRAGSDVGHFTAGAGIQLPRLRFDAAFLSHKVLGDTYRISVTIAIEEEKFRRH